MKTTLIVAVNGSHLNSLYSSKTVSNYGNYSTWKVTITIDDDGLKTTSIRIHGVNVEKPTKKSLENYALLHSFGLI